MFSPVFLVGMAKVLGGAPQDGGTNTGDQAQDKLSRFSPFMLLHDPKMFKEAQTFPAEFWEDWEQKYGVETPTRTGVLSVARSHLKEWRGVYGS